MYALLYMPQDCSISYRQNQHQTKQQSTARIGIAYGTSGVDLGMPAIHLCASDGRVM